jgi:hypothetical protein
MSLVKNVKFIKIKKLLLIYHQTTKTFISPISPRDIDCIIYDEDQSLLNTTYDPYDSSLEPYKDVLSYMFYSDYASPEVLSKFNDDIDIEETLNKILNNTNDNKDDEDDYHTRMSLKHALR